MTTISERRDLRVAILRENAVHLLHEEGLSRAVLERIADGLRDLAAERDLWTGPEFPPPGEEERQTRYLIAGGEDQSFVLYLNVMRPGKRIPPHDHTTWACIAAVEGAEENTLWIREDDRSVPGRARIRPGPVHIIEPGAAIAMMPEDIHSVFIPGDAIIRHLHFYGRALESLTGRTLFDPDTGEFRPMPVGVQTRKGPGA